MLLNFSAMIANNKGADQTARKTSAFIVLRDFSHRSPCDVEAQSSLLLPCCAPLSWNKYWGPQGFGGAGEKGYIFLWSWAALVIISGIWGANLYFWGFGEPCKKVKINLWTLTLKEKPSFHLIFLIIPLLRGSPNTPTPHPLENLNVFTFEL